MAGPGNLFFVLWKVPIAITCWRTDDISVVEHFDGLGFAGSTFAVLFFLRTQDGPKLLAAVATALAGLLRGDLLALFSRFGKPDRDGLLATFNCTAFATLSAL